MFALAVLKNPNAQLGFQALLEPDAASSLFHLPLSSLPCAPWLLAVKSFSPPDLFSVYDPFPLLVSFLCIITRIIYSVYPGKWNTLEETNYSALVLKLSSVTA